MCAMPTPSGSAGWDQYAEFYDWENAQTMARRDVAFWRQLALAAEGRVLELGCGTGRVTIPLARAGAPIVGVDLSAPMLARARKRTARLRVNHRPRLVRGDIRALPFPDARFGLVAAPYGILQSLLNERDLTATLKSVARVLAPGGRVATELVADLPSWREYPQPDPAPRVASGEEGARHARRVGRAAACTRPHALSPGLHREARALGDTPAVCAGVSHDFTAADGPAVREGRPDRHGQAGQLRRRPVDAGVGDVAPDRGKAPIGPWVHRSMGEAWLEEWLSYGPMRP